MSTQTAALDAKAAARKVENAKLNAAVGYAVAVGRSHNKATFFDELKPEFEFVSAYYDPQDGIPVTVFKIRTNAHSQDHRGEMHAGAFCLLVDNITTNSVYTDLKWYEFPDNDPAKVQYNPELISKIPFEFGISRTLKIHRNRPIKAGSTIYMATKILENTPVSSFCTCMAFDEDGRLLATGQHDKTKLTKVVKPKL